MTAEVKCPDSPTGKHVFDDPFNIKDGIGTIRCRYCPIEKKAVTCPEAIKDPELRKWAFRDPKGRMAIVLRNKEAEMTVATATEANQANQEEAPPPKPKGTWAKSRYYTANKARILEDIESMGATKTRKKWGIASGTLTGLTKRWEAQEKQPGIPAQAGEEKPGGTPASHEKAILLAIDDLAIQIRKMTEILEKRRTLLPAWAEIKTESEAVKLKWLDVCRWQNCQKSYQSE